MNQSNRFHCSAARRARILVFVLAVLASFTLAPCHRVLADDASPPSVQSSDTKAAKDLLAKLADIYQKASDLDYKSTLVVNGPLNDSGKPSQSVTLLVTGAAEKPNKFSVKAFDKKKLTEFFFSDGTTTYQFDPVTAYYEKMPQPQNGLDLPAVHTTGLMNAADYATSFAAKMFFEDNPYDLSYAATDADTDVQFSLKDMKIGGQAVTQITEVLKDDKGSTTTLVVALDKVTTLPRRVSEDVTTGGQTRTVFTEDYDSIHIGSEPSDAGTYIWNPPAGMVMNWTPPAPDKTDTNANANAPSGGS